MSELVERLERLKEVLEQTNNKAGHLIADEAADRIEELEAENERLNEVIVKARQSASYIGKQLQRPSSEQEDAWNYISLGVDELRIVLGILSFAEEHALAHQHDDDGITAQEASDFILKTLDQDDT